MRSLLLIIATFLAAIGAVVFASPIPTPDAAPFLVVLGNAQDAGYPQAGCQKACCEAAWNDPRLRRMTSCIAVVDPATSERWIFDATPDLREQLRMLDRVTPPRSTPDLAGVLLTHAHIGHYTGLMFLGHESIGAKGVPVHAMPRMHAFLATSGPWDQLVRFGNIELRALHAGQTVALNERVSVTPFLVPHRDEYSEVVGFRIDGPMRAAVFIPDIDKWERWDTRIEDVLAEVDLAYLDGTFYTDGELPGRDMSVIPHPFIAETMTRLAPLSESDRRKVRFIHLNHTNPALRPGAARDAIEAAGFAVAEQLERFDL
ncbi:MAG: MBL fold metallo-hydrolase [Planctomycetota bacterium]|jgi:pyrroloquinoline quinone biosynthesis protein B